MFVGAKHSGDNFCSKPKVLYPLAIACRQAYASPWPYATDTTGHDMICSRSPTTVRRWFAKGDRHRHPQPHDLRHLALMNFLLEHFEAIPPELREQLCLANL